MNKFNIEKLSVKQCVNPIYTYRVEFVPEDFIKWLKPYGNTRTMDFSKKLLLFTHSLGFRLSTVINGSIIKIHSISKNDDGFNLFENNIFDFFKSYKI